MAAEAEESQVVDSDGDESDDGALSLPSAGDDGTLSPQLPSAAVLAASAVLPAVAAP